jgi:hypothetical protein
MRLAEPQALREHLATLRVPRPPRFLTALVLVQWILLLLLVRRTTHNGWFFYQGGDETLSYSAAWSLANGHVPQISIGYGWPLLMAPIAGICGLNFLDGVPALVLVQTVLLLPLALFAVYGIASRIGGRLLGRFTAISWVVVPYAAIPLFSATYRHTYEDQILPQALGLSGLGLLPSVVCVLLAGYFAVTSLDTADPVRAVLSGVLAGFAIGIDPANALFVAAPLVAFALARRWRSSVFFGLALLPAVATAALWNYRGLGHIPLHARIDPHHLHLITVEFRRLCFSDRLIEVPFVAGVIAIGRRSWTKSAFVAVWFVTFLTVAASAPQARVEDGSLFRLLMPAFPAFLIACCSIPLLVPRVGARLAEWLAHERSSPLDRRDRRIIAVAVALAALPIVVAAVLPVRKGPSVAAYQTDGVVVPVDPSFRPGGRPSAGAFALSWPARTSDGGPMSYDVFISPADATDVTCETGRRPSACRLTMQLVGAADGPAYADKLRPGRWTYRVAAAVRWPIGENAADVMLLSPPLDVSSPG